MFYNFFEDYVVIVKIKESILPSYLNYSLETKRSRIRTLLNAYNQNVPRVYTRPNQLVYLFDSYSEFLYFIKQIWSHYPQLSLYLLSTKSLWKK